jgi:allophanate hydrolase subunit 1
MAQTIAQIETLITELDARIASGVEETIVDGTKMRVNIDAMKMERTRLQRRLAKLRRPNGYSFVRSVDLGGF